MEFDHVRSGSASIVDLDMANFKKQTDRGVVTYQGNMGPPKQHQESMSWGMLSSSREFIIPETVRHETYQHQPQIDSIRSSIFQHHAQSSSDAIRILDRLEDYAQTKRSMLDDDELVHALANQLATKSEINVAANQGELLKVPSPDFGVVDTPPNPINAQAKQKWNMMTSRINALQALKNNKLSNWFNDLSAKDLKSQASYENEVKKLADNLINEQKRREKQAKRSRIGNDLSPVSPQAQSEEASHRHFLDHFKIEKVLSLKCMTVKWNRHFEKRYMLKQIPSNLLERNPSSKESEASLIENMLKDWVNMKPLVPDGGVVQCYGSIKVQDQHYMITDLVVNAPINENTFMLDYVESPVDSLDLAKNVYTVLKKMELGNLAEKKEIPKHLIRLIIEFSKQVAKQFAHAHSNNLTHCNFNLSKVLAKDFHDPISFENYDFSNVKFYLTNFEPWKVEALNNKLAAFSNFTREFNIDVDRSDLLKPAKILDLQAFGNGILELMVGKSQELASLVPTPTASPRPNRVKGNTQHHRKLNNSPSMKRELIKSFTGGISIDSLPLNWGKVKLIQKILEILQLCFGPYDLNNSFANVDTSKQFMKIHDALCSLSNDSAPRPVIEISNRILEAEILNNQAVFKYLSLHSDTSFDQRLNTIKSCHELLEKAIQISCGSSAIPILNLLLLSWQLGKLSEDNFNTDLYSKVNNLEPHSAYMMYLLFKKYVQGFAPKPLEMEEVFLRIDENKPTDLSKYLSSLSDFQRHQADNSLSSSLNDLDHENIIFTNKGQNMNQQVKLPPNFQPSSLTFSNNDQFMIVLGQSEFLLIELKSGKIIHTGRMPNQGQFSTTNATDPLKILDSAFITDTQVSRQMLDLFVRQESSSHLSQITDNLKEGGDDELSLPAHKIEQTSRQGLANQSTMQQSSAEVTITNPVNALQSQKYSESNPSIPNTPISDQAILQQVTDILAKQGQKIDKTLAKKFLFKVKHNIELTAISSSDDEESTGQVIADKQDHLTESSQSIDSLDRAILNQKIQEDQKLVERQFPCDWVADIRNNGSSVALFDRSQQVRNKAYKFVQNKQETLYIYSMSVVAERAQFEPVQHNLDMRKLLNNNEVLSFGFDDFNQSFGTICVQAKNLQLYMIDFTTSQVLKRITDPCSVNLKSVFYDFQTRDQSMSLFDGVKEFIQNEEAQGNKVLIPKLNNKFLAVQQGDSKEVKIFSISSRTFIRSFNVDPEPRMFDYFQLPTEEFDFELDLQQKLIKNNEKRKLALREKERQDEQGDQGTLKLKYHKPWTHPSQKISSAYTLEVMTEYESTRSKLKKKLKKQRKEQANSLKETNVDMMTISSKGSYLAFYCKNSIYLRVIQSNFFQDSIQLASQDEYRKSLLFMPVFLSTQSDLSNTSVFDACQQTKLEPFHPGQVDLICIAISQIKSQHGSYISTALKVDEIMTFLKQFMGKPERLIDSNLRQKNRTNKLKKILTVVRSLPDLDKDIISLESFNGFKNMFQFRQLDFERSNEHILNYATSSNVETYLCAVLQGRKLKVYDFISDKCLFQFKTPQAMVYNQLKFLDSDSLLVLQDSDYSFVIISVQGHIKEAELTQKIRHEDILVTEKKEGPIVICDKFEIENKMLDEGDNDSEQSQREIEGEKTITQRIQLDARIEKFFTSRNLSKLSHIAVVNNQLLTIYSCYMEPQGHVELIPVWENDFRFDKQLRSLGKIITVDFDYTGQYMIVSTQSSDVVIFNIQNKEVIDIIAIKPPNSNNKEQIDLIRVDSFEDGFLTYSQQSATLYYTTVEHTRVLDIDQENEKQKVLLANKIEEYSAKAIDAKKKNDRKARNVYSEVVLKANIELEERKKREYEYKVIREYTSQSILKLDPIDKHQFGNLVSINVDVQAPLFYLCTFQHGHLVVIKRDYETDSFKVIQKCKVADSSIQIDDRLSYATRVDKANKEVVFSIIDWECSVDVADLQLQSKELKKPSIKISKVKMKRTNSLKQLLKMMAAPAVQDVVQPPKMDDDSKQEEPQVAKTQVCNLF